MNGWDKVFTAGKHTDSSGNVKNWTTADLDRMVASFNPAYHEPPITIGHPSDNAPAFGWVAGIKRVGSDLYLSYRDIAPQFKEWVGQGLYKKKSIAVYPDGSLRHIGYLGAMPPAIKGLPDFQFKADQEFSTFGCCEQVELGIWRRMKNWLIGKEGQAQADILLPEYELEMLARDAYQPETPDTINPSFHETKEEGMTEKDVAKIVSDATKEFSEQMKTLAESVKTVTETLKTMGTQYSELEKAQAAGRVAALERGFREFLESPEMQKRIPEGSRAATIAQMVTLSALPAVEFGEGDAKKSIPAVDHYKTQLQALPEIVAFGEHATKTNAADSTVNGMSVEVLSQKAVEFQESEGKAGRTITMTAAVNHIKTTGGK